MPTRPASTMRTALLLVLSLAGSAMPAAAQPLQALGLLPGGTRSGALAVTADGTLVAGLASRTQSGTEAGFRWTEAGGMVSLGDPPAGGFFADMADMSADGSVICGAVRRAATGLDGLGLWTAAGWADLGNPFATPSGTSSVCRFLSDDGSTLVGISSYSDGRPNVFFRGPVGGGFTELPAPAGLQILRVSGLSADGRVAVGTARGSALPRAVRWGAAGAALFATPPGAASEVAAVSADGRVAAGYVDGTGRVQAARWDAAGSRLDLGPQTLQALYVSADGRVVVGDGLGADGRNQTFRWTEAGAVLLDRPPGWDYTFPAGLSADGSVVVGTGRLAGGSQARVFAWSADGGTRDLGAIGVGFTQVGALSADGSTLAGLFTRESGQTEAFISRLGRSAAFVVRDAGDAPDAAPGDGACATDAGACTLRAALAEANAARGARVTFALPAGAEIQPQTPLPAVARAMTLDGTASGGGVAALDGAQAPAGTDGLRITAAGVTVRGLAVTRFPGYGVRVDGAAGVRLAGNRLGVAADGLREANRAGALRLAGAADAQVGSRGPEADRNTLFGPLVADAAARARVYLNTLEVPAADAAGVALRSPLDVGDDGPTCGAWARTSVSTPAPPRVLSLSAGRVRGIAAPGDTVAVYRVTDTGAGNGRYWARRAEPLALATADATGAFEASVALAPGDRVALAALSADGRTSELSQVRRPVVVAPGIGGTWLRDAAGADLWIPLAFGSDEKNARMRRLALADDGATSAEPLVADEVLEGVGPVRIVYGPLHDALAAAGYPGDARNANAPALDQWRFANDWRRSATVLADSLHALLDRVTTASGRTAQSAARACQADVVAHSNGGVIAAVYLRRDADHARDRVHRLVTSGTPYLGADQAVAAHTSGYVFGADEEIGGGALGLALGGWSVAWGDMIAMTRNVPGAYGLLPSRAYVDAADETAPTYAHGYRLVDLAGTPLVGYGATVDFLTAPKTGPGGLPGGLARNRPIADAQDADVHARIDDWRTYDGPPQIFRHVGRLAAQTEVGWFLGSGPATLAASGPGASPRAEPGDTPAHVAYRERLRPVYGWGDRTVPLLSATLGRSPLVGDTDLSGVDESPWIEEFEAFACAHGDLVAPDCRAVGGGPDALDRIAETLAAGSVVPPAARAARRDEAGIGETAGADEAAEVVYVMATAPVAVAVTDAAGRVTGAPDAAALGAERFEIPGVAFRASRLGATLALPTGAAYTVSVTSADPAAVVTLVRQRVAGDARTQVLFAEQPLPAGGTLRLALAAAGTPDAAAWTRDADGDGTPEASVAPAAILASTAAVLATPLPQPAAFDVPAASVSDVRTATLRLPDTGTAGWTFALAEPAPWLTLSATAGASPAAVTLTLDPAGLPDGPVTTTLQATLSNGGYAVTVAVPVTLRVGGVVAGEGTPEARFALAAPRPNPARGRVVVPFSLATAGPVRLVVLDVLGREVARLADGSLAAGPHDAVVDAGRLAPGAYVVRLSAGTAVATQRLVVVR